MAIAIGSLVASEGWSRPDTIPAIRSMRGRIVWLSADGSVCRVRWTEGVDGAPLGEDVNPRHVSSVETVEP